MLKFKNVNATNFKVASGNYSEASKQRFSEEDLDNVKFILTNENTENDFVSSSINIGKRDGDYYVSMFLKLHPSTSFSPKLNHKIDFTTIRKYVESIELVTFNQTKECKYGDKNDQVIIKFKPEFESSVEFEDFEKYDYYRHSKLPMSTPIECNFVNVDDLPF